MGRIKVIIPSDEEQQAIIAFLDDKCAAINGIIADKRKQLKITDEYKKSLTFEYATGKKEVIMT